MTSKYKITDPYYIMCIGFIVGCITQLIIADVKPPLWVVMILGAVLYSIYHVLFRVTPTSSAQVAQPTEEPAPTHECEGDGVFEVLPNSLCVYVVSLHLRGERVYGVYFVNQALRTVYVGTFANRSVVSSVLLALGSGSVPSKEIKGSFQGSYVYAGGALGICLGHHPVEEGAFLVLANVRKRSDGVILPVAFISDIVVETWRTLNLNETT
jgi:hypothetical protein